MCPIKDVQRREDLPYDFVGHLGRGGDGVVWEVERRSDKFRFAMKVMYTDRRTRRALEQTLVTEVETIERLESHHHFIKLYDAYKTTRELGLVIWPVADGGSLKDYLEDYCEEGSKSSAQTSVLCRAFGCLIEGLSFMYRHRIRHKDVKPGNILVHQGKVMCKYKSAFCSSVTNY
jgi:serine/threonine protein kinase